MENLSTRYYVEYKFGAGDNWRKVQVESDYWRFDYCLSYDTAFAFAAFLKRYLVVDKNNTNCEVRIRIVKEDAVAFVATT